MNNVYIRRHRDDEEMIEIFSYKGKSSENVVIWGVVHNDILSYLQEAPSLDDLDNCGEFALKTIL